MVEYDIHCAGSAGAEDEQGLVVSGEQTQTQEAVCHSSIESSRQSSIESAIHTPVNQTRKQALIHSAEPAGEEGKGKRQF